MKVDVQVLPFGAGNRERLAAPKTQPAFRFEEEILPGQNTTGILILPEWGLFAIYFTGGGQFALVADGTEVLNELATSGAIVTRSWRNETIDKNNHLWHTLSKPDNPVITEVNPIKRYWHTKISPTKFDGLSFANLAVNQVIEISIT